VKEIVALLKTVTLHCTLCVTQANFAPVVLLSVFDVSPHRPKFYISFGKKNSTAQVCSLCSLPFNLTL
jgi:hypothetical protein